MKWAEVLGEAISKPLESGLELVRHITPFSVFWFLDFII